MVNGDRAEAVDTGTNRGFSKSVKRRSEIGRDVG